MISGAFRNAGGAEVQSQNTVGIDLSVVELDGLRQADVVVLYKSVGVDGPAASYSFAASHAGAIGISHSVDRRFEADGIVRRVKQNVEGFGRAEAFVGHAAHRDPAFRIHRHVKRRPLSPHIIPRHLCPLHPHHQKV